MDIENLADYQLFELHQKIADKLGFYHMVTVSVDDIQNHFDDLHGNRDIDSIPDEKTIRQACGYVYRKFDCDDWSRAVDWIVEVADKLHNEVNA